MWRCEHHGETITTPAAIWNLWQDVSGWSGWNHGVADAQLTGSFAAGSTIAMTLPDGEVVFLTLEAVEEPVSFIHVASVDRLILRTDHRLEPIGDTGGHRVVYALTVNGPAPAEVLEEVGLAVSGDFPDVIAPLLAAAERASAR